jgi:hypothetical protein
MRLLYNFATRSRPEKFFKVLDNIKTLARHEDWRVIVTADADDSSMANEEVKNRAAGYENVIIYYGFSKNKIDAINRSLPFAGDFDILINISDDQLFLVEGFDLEIIKDMQEFFPDTDGFLHYPDSFAKDKLATLSIIGKKYFDRTHYIYNPEYKFVYCDNEAYDVAIMLGKHKFIDKKIYDHYHPVWRLAEWDELYRKSENPTTYAIDGATYQLRKANNFYLNL